MSNEEKKSEMENPRLTNEQVKEIRFTHQPSDVFRQEFLCMPPPKQRPETGCPGCDLEQREIVERIDRANQRGGYKAAFDTIMQMMKKYPVQFKIIPHRRQDLHRADRRLDASDQADALMYATFPMKPAGPADNMTVGEVMENFMGVKGASKDPKLDYQRGTPVKKDPPPMSETTKALIKALEAGGYNAAPTKLMGGEPLKVESFDLTVKEERPGIFSVKPTTLAQGEAALTEAFRSSWEKATATNCECGAHKASGAERGSQLHSSWCPWSKK